MLFDLEFTGHHASYIKLIVKYWLDHKVEDKLTILVCPEFIEYHASLIETYILSSHKNIFIHSITKEESELLASRGKRLNRFFRRLQEWKLLKKYALQLDANHCLVMLIDQLQLPIIFHWKLPCSFSGIYFLPSLHYFTFKNYTPSFGLTLKSIRDRLFLWRLSNHPNFHTLLSLDSYAVKFIGRHFPKLNTVHLPDPIYLEEKSNDKKPFEFKNGQDIENHRKVFLMFGNLDERKGIFQVLESLSKLDRSLHERICLIFAGKMDAKILKDFQENVHRIIDDSQVQIISQLRFLSEEEVESLFEISDIVLAPYQNHVGMSGILLLAAVHQKAVISQNFGLMGELVRRFKLGMTVDSLNLESISQAIEECLTKPCDEYFNAESALEFAHMHDSHKFALTITRSIIYKKVGNQI
jgi:glycosyltransferase involved in cell wall biosynthesis